MLLIPFSGAGMERHIARSRQDRVRRAVAMRMVLFREYLASLDRWAMGKASW